MRVLTDPRDVYTKTFAEQALGTLLGILSKIEPGRLREFTIRRDESGDRVECVFELDARPGVEYRYRQGIIAADREPLMAAESAVGVLMGAIVERIEFRRDAVDGRIDLS